jgi:hypothetical protein
MFVVVYQGWGHISVFGPFETKHDANEYVITSLMQEMLPHWGEPWNTMNEKEVREWWRERPWDMFEDTNQKFDVVALEAPTV